MDFRSLANKNILLGVSGSIAAYKACELLRLYQQHFANNEVIMTKQATEFVTPLTFQALCGRDVHTDLVDYKSESGMGHIQLARWADAMVIAPASAALISRLAKGDASDLLTAVFLATTAPRIIAPAMNKEMWNKKATQDNLKIISKFDNTYIVMPGSGWQACGEIGAGRLAEPSKIAQETAKLFANGMLAGKKVLLTAGPTREPLDQARFLSNYSSGKMGYALAQAAIDAGAETILVSGPVALDAPPRSKTIKVETAQEMLNACKKNAKDVDAFIGVAAVADWRPAKPSNTKLAKQDIGSNLALASNPDILAEMASVLSQQAIKVGFAAQASQTHLPKNSKKPNQKNQDMLAKAKAKLQAKELDMICANDINNAFGTEDNEISIIFPKKKTKQLKRMTKASAARLIIQEIAALLPN